ncbi:MAG: ABC transporter ATP-binding protein [Pseudobdellovibrionaceae bacterium]|nr:ABC transporter ATP-binding protein [Bdellovibrionales bacterium]USN48250.1 MAG: ABC transporter ATP-binding protein [Pseudobdellovibrionaceae bacterium]
MQQPLEISHLVKNYGTLRAVNDVSFSLKKGEIFGLLGPNGAGKTSIISTIVTIEKPTEGVVKVFGHDVVSEPKLAKMRIGFVPQELINHGYFTVTEILQFYAGFFGIRRCKDRIDYLLQRLQLWEQRDRRVKQLSGGMKRRLLIAKALVHEPELLLLDEPTAGVDIELRTNLWEFVQELRSEGMTVLLTTHYLEEAEELCDRVGILQKGTLVRLGPTKGLVQDLTQREICFYFKDKFSQIDHPLLVEVEEKSLRFRVPAEMGVGDLLTELKLDMKSIMDVRIQEGRLEDAFKSVLGDS